MYVHIRNFIHAARRKSKEQLNSFFVAIKSLAKERKEGRNKKGRNEERKEGKKGRNRMVCCHI